MKRSLVIFVCLFYLTSLVYAANACDLDISVYNQDPYPAVPGDLVKIVFQIDGISSKDCGDINFKLIEKFPFTLDPSSEKEYFLRSGTYSKDYNSFYMARFKVRVDEDALDGENPLEIQYIPEKSAFNSFYTKSFDIEVKDVRADFEIFLKDYDSLTNKFTFEILNIGNTNIEAVTIEIQDQESVQLLGSGKEIIGDLSSNEDTSFDMSFISSSDEVRLVIHYSDSINKRRTIEKIVKFNKNNFASSSSNTSGTFWVWFIIIILIGVVGYFLYKKKRKNTKGIKR